MSQIMKIIGGQNQGESENLEWGFSVGHGTKRAFQTIQKKRLMFKCCSSCVTLVFQMNFKKKKEQCLDIFTIRICAVQSGFAKHSLVSVVLHILRLVAEHHMKQRQIQVRFSMSLAVHTAAKSKCVKYGVILRT